jgi:hypothetical protein
VDGSHGLAVQTVDLQLILKHKSFVCLGRRGGDNIAFCSCCRADLLSFMFSWGWCVDSQCSIMISILMLTLEILFKSKHTSIKCCAYASGCQSEGASIPRPCGEQGKGALNQQSSSPNTRAQLNTTSIILRHSLTCVFATPAILPERVLNHLSQCLYNQAPDVFCRVPPHSFTQFWLPRRP